MDSDTRHETTNNSFVFSYSTYFITFIHHFFEYNKRYRRYNRIAVKL